MVYAALFIIVAALEIISAALIFIFKDILHTVLALSFLFIFNSALFLILQQPLLALLQLFILVGGVATYAFVGVSSTSYSNFKHTNYLAFIIIFLLLFFTLSYKAMQSTYAVSEPNTLSSAAIAQSLGSNIGTLYIIAAMLFGIGFGSIVLIKKLSGKK